MKRSSSVGAPIAVLVAAPIPVPITVRWAMRFGYLDYDASLNVLGR